MLELEIATENALSWLPLGNMGELRKKAAGWVSGKAAAPQKERLLSELCVQGTQAKEWGFRAQTPETMKVFPYLDAHV